MGRTNFRRCSHVVTLRLCADTPALIRHRWGAALLGRHLSAYGRAIRKHRDSAAIVLMELGPTCAVAIEIKCARLNALTGDSKGTESAYLKIIILGRDEERSILALEIAKNLRKGRSRTTHALLDYSDSVRSDIFALQNAHPLRMSIIDRMQLQKMFVALSTKLVAEEQLIQRYGYLVLARSAYASKRTREHSDGDVKAIFAPIARRWVEEVRDLPLGLSLSRDELVPLTSFLVWLRDQEDYAGFLRRKIVDTKALLAVAMSFVHYNEWVGSEVHYDIVFRSEEFLFATRGIDPGPLMADVPEVNGEPNYERSDRSSRDLSAAQRRDFAIRHLRSLEWD